MCGFVGWAQAHDHSIVLGDAFERAIAAIAHRGPDDKGIFHDDESGVILGHTRLSIQDLSVAGHQPMCSLDGQLVLVFNGEIYNFRELRAELIERGVSFSGGSDTEVLLQLYRHAVQCESDVDEFLRRLNGIFSFALWDARRGEVLLARDALGVKPLYVHSGPRSVVFGSEIKALLPIMGGCRNVDPVSLVRYVTHLWCPGEATPLADVRKLGPGQAMWLRDGAVRKAWCWYALPVSRRKVNSAANMSFSNAIRGTRRHLQAAVQRQMVADVPVGAFLSGGLDSSALVAFAREQAPNLQCFTIEASGGADSGLVDDLPYARRVAAHLSVDLHVVRVDASRMAQDLEQMVWQLDEPLADPAPLNVLYISRLAREHNIKVLLSGAGGDDLFTGYRRHLALQTEAYWRWLPARVRTRLQALTLRLDQRTALGRRMRKLFSGAGLEGDARLVEYFRWVDRADLSQLFNRDFASALDQAETNDPMRAFLASLPPEVPALQRMLALEQRFFLPDHNLTYTDKMAMAEGVEVRVPFLDLDLVDFCQDLPLRFKQRGRHGKWILKKAMEPDLPADVIWRPKAGFGAPLRRWMRNELREMLSDLLSEESLRRRGLFDPAAVQQLVAANDVGRVDASYTLLSLLCIEVWCRRFIDSSSGVMAAEITES